MTVPWAGKTQKDVMDHNQASKVWSRIQGEGVTIAIVDTGVDGAMAEFIRRSPHSYAPSFSTPWEDAVGHGTMCAAIACGTAERGGRYNGVAPAATLLSARSTLRSTDLYLIYQHLLREYRKGSFTGGLVVSNSYALYTCQAPDFPEGHPYLDLIRLCVQAGMAFVFAAGNNHGSGLCGFPAEDDGPNTIWTVNSIDEVITVGTVDWNESNRAPGGEHSNSSRGPGQWSRRADKPDVVAPTYGEVAWGGGYRSMEWWGTSGACPQVAGLAALLLAVDRTLTPELLRTTLRRTARVLEAPASCVGAGILDCEAAIASLTL
jgi:subtilisin family serine protease